MKYRVRKAFVPKDAKWYIAEIIQEFRVEGEETSLVWLNLLLVRADGPEEAYQKAMELGQDYDYSFEVGTTSIFRGLREVYVIHDELEHGAEILWEDKGELVEEAIQKMICSKEKLSIFRPMPLSDEETRSLAQLAEFDFPPQTHLPPSI